MILITNDYLLPMIIDMRIEFSDISQYVRLFINLNRFDLEPAIFIRCGLG
jgi:hypothetical protein